jgi:hypothetical protein
MPEITPTGIKIITQSEYKTRLKASYKSIDSKWVVDSNSPDGQRIMMDSRMLWELEQQAVAVRNSTDPRTAKYSQVDDLAALFDTYRADARQSKVTITLIGTDGTAVKSGQQIRNVLTGSVWSLDSDVIINSDANLSKGNFTSLDYGLITASGDFIPNTLSPGWSGVENPENFIIGREDESDEELERKRKQKVTLPALAIRAAIKAAILDVKDVISCDVIENDESFAVGGQPANSLHCIVSGGDEIEVCTAIDSKICPGVKTVGSIEHLVTTPEDKYGMRRRFDRPVYVDVWVRYTINNLIKIDDRDIGLIPGYVESYTSGQVDLPFQSNSSGFMLGQSPSADLLTTPLNWAIGDSVANDGSIYTTAIEFSKDGKTWIKNTLSIERLEQALFDESRVIVIGA